MPYTQLDSFFDYPATVLCDLSLKIVYLFICGPHPIESICVDKIRFRSWKWHTTAWIFHIALLAPLKYCSSIFRIYIRYLFVYSIYLICLIWNELLSLPFFMGGYFKVWKSPFYVIVPNRTITQIEKYNVKFSEMGRSKWGMIQDARAERTRSVKINMSKYVCLVPLI